MQESVEKQTFADRLNEALDEFGVPSKFEGRQVIVGRMFGVTQKGARKWLEGEGLPTLEKSIQIAKHLGVHVEWLLTGRGPKRITGDSHIDFVASLPEEVKQEAFDFLEFKVTKVLKGDQLVRYLRWIDRIKNAPPSPK